MQAPVKVGTLHEQIAAALRADVLSGHLRADQRLSQSELAKRFRVSRIPVRDALRILEAEGLVEYDPRNGASVAGISSDDLEELYEMRLALEPLNARLAAVRMTSEDVGSMAHHLDAMRRAEDDTPAWFEAHARFHQVLNERSGRKRIVALLDNWRKQTERYLRLYQLLRHDSRGLLDEHQRIHHAAAQEDPELVEQAVREHLQLVRDQVLESFRSAAGGDGAQ